MLEIGCGWGGFAIQAARERGAVITGVTVSRAQFDEARRRIQVAGLSERIDIRLCDYPNRIRLFLGLPNPTFQGQIHTYPNRTDYTIRQISDYQI